MSVAGAQLISALAALLAVVFFGLAVAYARGQVPLAARRRSHRSRSSLLETLPPQWRQRYRQLLVLAAVAGVGTWAFTGWPIQGVITAAVIAGLPLVLQPGGSAKPRIERLEALADWLQQLAGSHVAGLSLEETIRASAKNAPAPVRQPVGRLSTRLQTGWPAEEAYRALADEMADGKVDHVVLLLMTHARDRGPGLSKALQALAESMSEQARGAREVEADRSKVRAPARYISIFTLGAVSIGLLNRAWSSPYGTAVGQLLLITLGVMFTGLLLTMQRMARTRPEPRLFAPVDEPADTTDITPAAKLREALS